MASHVAGYQCLGHGLQGFERGHEIRQAHRIARIGQDVDEGVDAGDTFVGETAGKNYAGV